MFVRPFALQTDVGNESEMSFAVSSSIVGVASGNKVNRNAKFLHPSNARYSQLPQQHQVKIAAINGKPRVQRYLSNECEFSLFNFQCLSYL